MQVARPVSWRKCLARRMVASPFWGLRRATSSCQALVGLDLDGFPCALEGKEEVSVLIDTDEQLAAFVERCKSSRYMAIDTEFLRERTYYAKLCLIQIAIEGEIAIIDPFPIKNLKVLAPVLTDPNIIKIFHACSQDMEILYHDLGVLPTPVFDTQVAASIQGKLQQASYASLVSSYCGVNLQKKDSYTDWSRRPLRPSQVEYAADDVRYLPKIWETMVSDLKKERRLGWLDAAFAELTDPSKYETDPRERFRKLRRVNQLSPHQMAAAREFAAWREEKAMRRDVPRKRICSDEQIVEACRREARSIDELYMVRGLREALRNDDARRVVEAIKRGLECPDEDLPSFGNKNRNEENVDVMVDLMGAIVHLRAKENHIAVQTLAPHAELTKLARGQRKDCALLKGWRRKVVGEELLDLIEGKFLLGLDGPNLKIVRNK